MDPFEALGNPTRRALFDRLRGGPCSVGELVEAVPVSQPAVSQHLQVLREARLVSVRRQGQRRIYSVDPRGLAEMRAYVDGMWEAVLTNLQRAAEESVVEEANDE